MNKENAIINDTLAIVFLVFAGMGMFAMNSLVSGGLASGKSIFFACVACVGAYFVLCKTGAIGNRIFSCLLVLASVSASAYALFFSRSPRPQMFGIELPLAHLLVLAYFVVMQNENGSSSQFAEHAFLIFLFSAVLALCPDVQGLVFFTVFCALYALLNFGTAIFKSLFLHAFVLSFCAILVFSNEKTAGAFAGQLSLVAGVVGSSQNPVLSSGQAIYEVFGVAGIIFAFIMLCLLIFFFARNKGSVAFFICIIAMLCVSALASHLGSDGSMSFPFLPDNAISLVLCALVLANMTHMAESSV